MEGFKEEEAEREREESLELNRGGFAGGGGFPQGFFSLLF